MKLTDSQFNTLLVLQANPDISGVSFTGKATRRILADLVDFGMIALFPLSGTAQLLPAGRTALAEAKEGKK